MKIAIDAAHGGIDTGTKAFGRLAKDDALDVALTLRLALERCGFEVVPTRVTDTTLNDLQRAAICNMAEVDLVVSIDRGNGGAASLAFWAASACKPGELQGMVKIADATAMVAPVSTAGVRRGYPGNPGGDYKINRLTVAPSLLVHLLRINDKADNIVFEEKAEEYGEALCRGICEALGAVYIEPSQLTCKEETKKAVKKKTEENVQR